MESERYDGRDELEHADGQGADLTDAVIQAELREHAVAADVIRHGLGNALSGVLESAQPTLRLAEVVETPTFKSVLGTGFPSLADTVGRQTRFGALEAAKVGSMGSAVEAARRNTEQTVLALSGFRSSLPDTVGSVGSKVPISTVDIGAFAASVVGKGPLSKTLGQQLAGLGAIRLATDVGIATAAGKISLSETIGRKVAERASFTFASGLKIDDLLGTTSFAKSTSELLSTLAPKVGVSATVAGLGSGLISVDFGKTMAGATSAGRLAEGLIGEHTFAARSIAVRELTLSSGIADMVDAKTLAPWRQTLLAEATARSFAGTVTVPEGTQNLLRDIVASSATTARVVSRFADLNGEDMVRPILGVRPTKEMRAFLTGLPVAPTFDDLGLALSASRSAAGLTALDLLVGPGELDTDSGDLLEEEVVEPWVSGPEQLRSGLMRRLGDLDDTVPGFLQAAWDQVERNGPAAVSMAANAMVEAVDRTLRAIAPEDDVLAAAAQDRLGTDATYDAGGGRLKPTRAGRVAYALLMRRPPEAKLVTSHTKALTMSLKVVMDDLQSAKHTSAGSISLVRTYLVSVENVLVQLTHETAHD